MDASTPLWKAHDISQQLQDKIEVLPNVDRAFVHVDHETTHVPVRYSFMKGCSLLIAHDMISWIDETGTSKVHLINAITRNEERKQPRDLSCNIQVLLPFKLSYTKSYYKHSIP